MTYAAVISPAFLSFSAGHIGYKRRVFSASAFGECSGSAFLIGAEALGLTERFGALFFPDFFHSSLTS